MGPSIQEVLLKQRLRADRDPLHRLQTARFQRHHHLLLPKLGHPVPKVEAEKSAVEGRSVHCGRAAPSIRVPSAGGHCIEDAVHLHLAGEET